jgi:hypothetical protein
MKKREKRSKDEEEGEEDDFSDIERTVRSSTSKSYTNAL